MSAGNANGPYNYGRARVAGGLLLIALVALLTLLDALRADYMLDSIQLGLILGTGGTLLGVEALLRRISD